MNCGSSCHGKGPRSLPAGFRRPRQPICTDWGNGGHARGSNHGISLFDRAFDSPAVKAAVVEKGEIEHAGALGNAKSKTYSLEAPVGFGPFSLPAGQLVNRIRAESKDDKRFANVGNQLFAEMGLKILVSYRDKRLTFYGGCPAS
jgi:hypothetical protein